MFTGIIRATGRVAAVRTTQDGRHRLEIDPLGWSHRPAAGDSIAVDGCCLTLVSDPAPGGPWSFDVVPETLAKTTLGSLSVGRRVHLEHAATASTLLDGHVVQGHVDGVATVIDVRSGTDWRVRLRPPAHLLQYIIPKGSVTLAGVSLTVADVNPDSGEGWFEVALIPATLSLTTLGDLATGAGVNLECDAMAKTVVHWLRHFGSRSGA